MSAKPYCKVPRGWTLEDYSRHCCSDRSHSHISESQLHRLESRGLVRWLRRPALGEKAGVMVEVRDSSAPKSTRPEVRDLSCAVGEYLMVKAYVKRELWALVMLDDMDYRRLPAS